MKLIERTLYCARERERKRENIDTTFLFFRIHRAKNSRLFVMRMILREKNSQLTRFEGAAVFFCNVVLKIKEIISPQRSTRLLYVWKAAEWFGVVSSSRVHVFTHVREGHAPAVAHTRTARRRANQYRVIPGVHPVRRYRQSWPVHHQQLPNHTFRLAATVVSYIPLVWRRVIAWTALIGVIVRRVSRLRCISSPVLRSVNTGEKLQKVQREREREKQTNRRTWSCRYEWKEASANSCVHAE